MLGEKLTSPRIVSRAALKRGNCNFGSRCFCEVIEKTRNKNFDLDVKGLTLGHLLHAGVDGSGKLVEGEVHLHGLFNRLGATQASKSELKYKVSITITITIKIFDYDSDYEQIPI